MDVPRKLTEEEIDKILSSIPYPNAVTEKHAALAREQIIKVLRAELLEVELAPSGIDELTDRIVNQFEESRVRPGAMVGFAAAEAPSARFTQDNLSAVHKAGQSGMRGTGGAVARIADLVSKQQTKTTTSGFDSVTIFFSGIETEHSILRDKRAEMVSVAISDLLLGEDPSSMEYHSNIFKDGILPEWYHIYSELYNVPLPDLSQRENGKLLRLRLDLEKLVEYRVMVSDIRKALLSSNTRVLRFFVSPMHIGLVDIWALDEEFHSYGLDISGDVQLDVFNALNGISERLNRLFVKGIPGIKDVIPMKLDIWPLMKVGQTSRHVRDHIYEYRLSSSWTMRFDWKRVRMLWDHLNIKVVDFDSKYSSWVILDGGSATNPGPPDKIISDAVTADEAVSDSWQKAAVATGKPIVTRPIGPDSVLYWSQLWFARTDGSNLREIIVREDVDPRFTISNRPYEVLEMFGIVAARRVLLDELYNAFGSGTRNDPNFSQRHFSLLADFVCHTGMIKPISNLNSQARSTLSKATFARQFNSLVTPAIHGVDEQIGDVSAAIMVATKAKIGPRAFEYESSVNKGVTADEIKTALRMGSTSDVELEKLIAMLSDNAAEPPLYSEGREGARSAAAAAALMRDQDEDRQMEEEMVKIYEASAADLPPGIMEEDEEEAAQRRKADSSIIIEDDIEGDMEFGQYVQGVDYDNEEDRRSSRRRSRRPADTGFPVMSQALKEVIKKSGAVIEPSGPKEPPPPACPVSSHRSQGKKVSFT